MGYILFLVAYLLFLPLTIFNALNVRKKGYFLDTAINISRVNLHASAVLAPD